MHRIHAAQVKTNVRERKCLALGNRLDKLYYLDLQELF